MTDLRKMAEEYADKFPLGVRLGGARNAARADYLAGAHAALEMAAKECEANMCENPVDEGDESVNITCVELARSIRSLAAPEGKS